MLRLIGSWRGQFEDQTIPDPPLLYGKQFCTELDSSQIATTLAAARLMNPPYLLFYRSSDSTTGCAIDAKCKHVTNCYSQLMKERRRLLLPLFCVLLFFSLSRPIPLPFAVSCLSLNCKFCSCQKPACF
jgi:hypothetical protein